MAPKNASTGRYEYRTVGLGLLAGFIISLTYLSPSIYYSFPFTNVVTESSTSNEAPITSPAVDDPVISLETEARNQNYNITDHGSKPECDGSSSNEELCEKSMDINLSVAEASDDDHSSEESTVANSSQSPIVNNTEGNLKLDETAEDRSETNGDELVTTSPTAPTTGSTQIKDAGISDQSENNPESEGENSVSNETKSDVSQNDDKIMVPEDEDTASMTTDSTLKEVETDPKQSENNTESEDENSVSNETKPDVSQNDDKIMVPDHDDSTASTATNPTLKEVATNTKQSDDSEEDLHVLKETKITCDTVPWKRYDRCEMDGDVRVHGKTSSVVFTSSSSNETRKIKPYARKADPTAMGNVRELSVAPSSAGGPPPPRCTVSHSVPAVVFSSGGYCGNFFHDVSDVLVPLFQTTAHFAGEVQLLVADYHWWWNDKYGPVLKQLSRYEPIDLDADDRVHCFPRAAVGLRSDDDLKIDPSSPANHGRSMADFGTMLRAAFSLPRASPIAMTKKHANSGIKPRLFILARGHTRRFMNVEEIVRAAEETGYEAVVGEAEHNVTRFANLVNSCDVMMGVHGAGLTNFVFLPRGAIEIQVVPWGNLDWISENFYNKPARDMGLRYLEYRIGKEESTLSELYPLDDPVFTDPNSLHKQGWEKMKEIYLEKQNVRINVQRFRPVLVQALRMLRSKKKHS